jgi:hypothetical protein
MGHFRTWLMLGEGMRYLTLTREFAEGLHRQFLGLIRLVNAAADYGQAREAITRCIAFRDSYTELFLSTNNGSSKSRLEQVLAAMVREKFSYLGHNEQNDKVKWFDGWIRKECGEFWNDAYPSMMYPQDGAWWTVERCFSDFVRDRPKWARRAREKSKKAAAAIAWLADNMPGHLDADNPPTVRLPVHEPTTVEMHGFRVAIMDYNPDAEQGGSSPAHQERQIRTVREALRIFRQRGEQYFPWLVRNAVPLKLYMGTSNSAEAEYEGRDGGRSWINWYIGLLPDPVWGARTVAHEMGHHYWRSVLSEAARKSWREVVYLPSVQQRPSQIAAAVPPDEKWFSSYLQKRDPVNYLRVAGLYHDPSYRLDLHSREDLNRLADQGDEPLQMRRYPVTGYAAKNEEETFCEAVSLLVGNGTQYVGDHVLRWLRTVTAGDARH